MPWQPLPTPEDVGAFLRWDDTDETIAPHLASVTSFARSYTRDAGFSSLTDGTPLCRSDVAAVIVSATCRSVTNPAQVTREELGTYSAVPARFEGWTLAEQFVLNAYRRRTA